MTTAETTSNSNARVSTERRVRRRHTSLTYLPAASVACREDELLARLWGCKPASAHQRKLVINRQVADVIRIRREAGADESAAMYALPIEEALAHMARPSKAELAADQADAREDEIQAVYRDDRSDDNARRLLRARALERCTSLDADRELAARHGLTL